MNNSLKIILVDTSINDFSFFEAFNLISSYRKERTRRYLKEEDKINCLACGLLERLYVPYEIKINKFGKTYVDEKLFFNLSHSGNIVGLVLSKEDEVGIDLEKVKEIKKDLIDYSLPAEEKEYVKDEKDFFKIWTLKEACAKANGKGITNPKEDKCFLIDDNTVSFYEKTLHFSHKFLENGGNQYSLCVVSNKKIDEVKEEKFSIGELIKRVNQLG